MLKGKHAAYFCIFVFLSSLIFTASIIKERWNSDKLNKNSNDNCDISLLGQINESMLDRVNFNTCPNLKIQVSLIGGEETLSRKLAFAISEREAEITVKGVCLSACAEYLLPAATDIIFEQYPLVGYHGNPLSNMFFIQHYKAAGHEFCNFEEAKLFRSIYDSKNLSAEFWSLQTQKLGVSEVSFQTAIEKCPIVNVKYKYNFWFPKSDTLRKNIGLKFKGKTCADLDICGEQHLGVFFQRGEYLVGDTPTIL